MKKIDISLIITGHKEGGIIISTLLSTANAIRKAIEKGLVVERIVVLDNADQETVNAVAGYEDEFSSTSVYNVQFGDVGEARNFAVQKASGKWISFVDADDLVSSNWLYSAFFAAESNVRSAVWHPELNVYFGSKNHVFEHVDMDDPRFNASGLALTNYWTALCFAPRELLLRCPYAQTSLESKVGYEDWSWNLRVMSHDYIHKVVKDTTHLIRGKTQSNSLLQETNKAGCLPASTDYFNKFMYY